jgi:pimeloyl-ACP methyl ester carboxylesterase
VPEKYVRLGGPPILLRHTGASTLPERPPSVRSGRSVVCLHDAGLQSSIFTDLLAAIGDAACALAFDLPGHGRSGGLDALPSIEAMSACAQGVAEWCRAERPILVGHGMGALVALDWARRAPGSVGGLVLCATSRALGLRDDTIETMRSVTLGRAPRPFDAARLAPGAPRERMQRFYMESIQTDPRATLVDLEACRAFARSAEGGASERTDAPNAGHALRTPAPVATLIACGEAEPDADRTAAQGLAERLGARRETVREGASLLPLECPAALAREILRLLEAA